MRDQIWSISLGRWWNVHVRVHMFFLLFGAFTLYLSSQASADDVWTAPTWIGPGCVLILLVSVLLHEVGHVFVARKFAGLGDEIVIGPLGGLAPVRVPYEPQWELAAILAGPLVNSGICLLLAGYLSLEGSADLLGLLNPLSPTNIVDSHNAVDICRLVFWINWVLLIVNLIPTVPFDGGRALRAALMFVWPEIDSRQASLTVARLAKAVAALLLVVAWLVSGDNYPVTGVPTWFALTLLSIFVFFSARREEQQLLDPQPAEESMFGYDFSQGYTSLERDVDSGTTKTQVSAIAGWLERRRELRERRRRQHEAEEDVRVDEILARVHQHGIDSLSPEDRELLQRVSARYRRDE